ncbi:MAG: GldG family protein [Nitrospinota bacterium]
MKKRTMFYGSNMIIYSLVALGFAAVINYVSANNYKRYDFTENGRHTLTTQTVKTLKKLPFEVKVWGFVVENPAVRNRHKRLLEQYRYQSRKLSWELVDPDKKPLLAEKYEVTRYDVFLVEGPNGKRENIFGRLTEESLTNALLRIVSTRNKVVYFTGGHGEKDFNDTGNRGYNKANAALVKENFTSKELLLYSVDEVPEDASVVIVAGPEKDFFKDEFGKLEKYLRRGGRLFFMVDPFVLDTTVNFIKRYGIKPDDNVIVDQVSKTLGGDNLAPTVANYEPHPITKDFRLMTFFPITRSLELTDSQIEDVSTFAIAKSLPSAWGETNKDELAKGVANYVEAEDAIGPLTIAAVAELASNVDGKIKKGELMVIGDSDFAANAYADVAGNLDFFMNSVNWLAEEGDRIAIRPKKAAMDPIMFSNRQMAAISGINALLLPLLVLGAGIWINVRRRRS